MNVDLLNKSMNSAGLANKQFEEAQKGVEAQLAKTQAVLEEFYGLFVNADQIIGVNKIFRTIVGTLTEVLKIVKPTTIGVVLFNKVLGNLITTGISKWQTSITNMINSLGILKNGFEDLETPLSNLGKINLSKAQKELKNMIKESTKAKPINLETDEGTVSITHGRVGATLGKEYSKQVIPTLLGEQQYRLLGERDKQTYDQIITKMSTINSQAQNLISLEQTKNQILKRGGAEYDINKQKIDLINFALMNGLKIEVNTNNTLQEINDALDEQLRSRTDIVKSQAMSMDNDKKELDSIKKKAAGLQVLQTAFQGIASAITIGLAYSTAVSQATDRFEYESAEAQAKISGGLAATSVGGALFQTGATLGATPAGIPLMVAGGAIAAGGAIVSGTGIFDQAQIEKDRKTYQKLMEDLEGYKQKLQGFAESSRMLLSMSNDFDILSRSIGVNGENLGLTNEEYNKYNQYANQIANRFPDLIKGYTDEGNAILDNTNKLQNYLDKIKEEEQEEKKRMAARASIIAKEKAAALAFETVGSEEAQKRVGGMAVRGGRIEEKPINLKEFIGAAGESLGLVWNGILNISGFKDAIDVKLNELEVAFGGAGVIPIDVLKGQLRLYELEVQKTTAGTKERLEAEEKVVRMKEEISKYTTQENLDAEALVKSGKDFKASLEEMVPLWKTIGQEQSNYNNLADESKKILDDMIDYEIDFSKIIKAPTTEQEFLDLFGKMPSKEEYSQYIASQYEQAEKWMVKLYDTMSREENISVLKDTSEGLDRLTSSLDKGTISSQEYIAQRDILIKQLFDLSGLTDLTIDQFKELLNLPTLDKDLDKIVEKLQLMGISISSIPPISYDTLKSVTDLATAYEVALEKVYELNGQSQTLSQILGYTADNFKKALGELLTGELGGQALTLWDIAEKEKKEGNIEGYNKNLMKLQEVAKQQFAGSPDDYLAFGMAIQDMIVQIGGADIEQVEQATSRIIATSRDLISSMDESMAMINKSMSEGKASLSEMLEFVSKRRDLISKIQRDEETGGLFLSSADIMASSAKMYMEQTKSIMEDVRKANKEVEKGATTITLGKAVSKAQTQGIGSTGEFLDILEAKLAEGVEDFSDFGFATRSEVEKIIAVWGQYRETLDKFFGMSEKGLNAHLIQLGKVQIETMKAAGNATALSEQMSFKGYVKSEIDSTTKDLNKLERSLIDNNEQLADLEKQYNKTMKKLAEDDRLLDIQYGFDTMNFQVGMIDTKLEVLNNQLDLLGDKNISQSMELYNQVLDESHNKLDLLEGNIESLMAGSPQNAKEAEAYAKQLESSLQNWWGTQKTLSDTKKQMMDLQKKYIQDAQERREKITKENEEVTQNILDSFSQVRSQLDKEMGRGFKKIRFKEIFTISGYKKEKDPIELEKLQTNEMLKIREEYYDKLNEYKKMALDWGYQEEKESIAEQMEETTNQYNKSVAKILEANKELEDSITALKQTLATLQQWEQYETLFEQFLYIDALGFKEKAEEIVSYMSEIFNEVDIKTKPVDLINSLGDTFAQSFVESFDYIKDDPTIKDSFNDLMQTIASVPPEQIENLEKLMGVSFENILGDFFEAATHPEDQQALENLTSSLEALQEAYSKLTTKSEEEITKIVNIDTEATEKLKTNAQNSLTTIEDTITTVNQHIKDLIEKEKEAKENAEIIVNAKIGGDFEVTNGSIANMISALEELHRLSDVTINATTTGGASGLVGQSGNIPAFASGYIIPTNALPTAVQQQITNSIFKPRFGPGSSNSSMSAFANGTSGTQDDDFALTGELGEELAILPNGHMTMLGKNGPEMSYLPKGTVIYNNDDTKKVLKYINDPESQKANNYFRKNDSLSSIFSNKLNSYADGNTKLNMPMSGTVRLTSGFGYRDIQLEGASKNHKALDLVSDDGRIYAAADGIVVKAGYADKLGSNYIEIKHDNGIITTYGHNSAKYVKEGDSVKAGTLIAKMGAEGNVTGAHLHFGVKKDGQYVNPTAYLDSEYISSKGTAVSQSTSPSIDAQYMDSTYTPSISNDVINYLDIMGIPNSLHNREDLYYLYFPHDEGGYQGTAEQDANLMGVLAEMSGEFYSSGFDYSNYFGADYSQSYDMIPQIQDESLIPSPTEITLDTSKFTNLKGMKSIYRTESMADENINPYFIGSDENIRILYKKTGYGNIEIARQQNGGWLVSDTDEMISDYELNSLFKGVIFDLKSHKLNKYSKGTANGTPTTDFALTGELGEELAILPNGRMTMLGKSGPEMSYLPKGTVIYNHDDTKQIQKYVNNANGKSIKAYSTGTTKLSSYKEGTTNVNELMLQLIGKAKDIVKETTAEVPSMNSFDDFNKIMEETLSKLANESIDIQETWNKTADQIQQVFDKISSGELINVDDLTQSLDELELSLSSNTEGSTDLSEVAERLTKGLKNMGIVVSNLQEYLEKRETHEKNVNKSVNDLLEFQRLAKSRGDEGTYIALTQGIKNIDEIFLELYTTLSTAATEGELLLFDEQKVQYMEQLLSDDEGTLELLEIIRWTTEMGESNKDLVIKHLEMISDIESRYGIDFKDMTIEAVEETERVINDFELKLRNSISVVLSDAAKEIEKSFNQASTFFEKMYTSTVIPNMRESLSGISRITNTLLEIPNKTGASLREYMGLTESIPEEMLKTVMDNKELARAMGTAYLGYGQSLFDELGKLRVDDLKEAGVSEEQIQAIKDEIIKVNNGIYDLYGIAREVGASVPADTQFLYMKGLEEENIELGRKQREQSKREANEMKQYLKLKEMISDEEFNLIMTNERYLEKLKESQLKGESFFDENGDLLADKLKEAGIDVEDVARRISESGEIYKKYGIDLTVISDILPEAERIVNTMGEKWSKLFVAWADYLESGIVPDLIDKETLKDLHKLVEAQNKGMVVEELRKMYTQTYYDTQAEALAIERAELDKEIIFLEHEKLRAREVFDKARERGAPEEEIKTAWEKYSKFSDDLEKTEEQRRNVIKDFEDLTLYEAPFVEANRQLEKMTQEYENQRAIISSLRKTDDPVYRMKLAKQDLVFSQSKLKYLQQEYETRKHLLQEAQDMMGLQGILLEYEKARTEEIVKQNELFLQFISDSWDLTNQVINKMKKSLEDIRKKSDILGIISDINLLKVEISEFLEITDFGYLDIDWNMGSILSELDNVQNSFHSLIGTVDILSQNLKDMSNFGKDEIAVLDERREKLEEELQLINSRTEIEGEALKRQEQILEEINEISKERQSIQQKITDMLEGSAIAIENQVILLEKEMSKRKQNIAQMKEDRAKQQAAYNALIKAKDDEIDKLQKAKDEEDEINDMLKLRLDLLKAMDDVSHEYITGAGIRILRPDVEKIDEIRGEIAEKERDEFYDQQIKKLQDERDALAKEQEKEGKEADYAIQLEEKSLELQQKQVDLLQQYVDTIMSEHEQITFGRSDKQLEEFINSQLSSNNTQWNNINEGLTTLFKETLPEGVIAPFSTLLEETTNATKEINIMIQEKWAEVGTQLHGDYLKAVIRFDVAVTKYEEATKKLDLILSAGPPTDKKEESEDSSTETAGSNKGETYTTEADISSDTQRILDNLSDISTPPSSKPTSSPSLPYSQSDKATEHTKKVTESLTGSHDSQKTTSPEEDYPYIVSQGETLGNIIRARYLDKYKTSPTNAEVLRILELIKILNQGINVDFIWAGQEIKIPKFDTGGYTGDWGSDGRLGILHQKELILNQYDTANLLETIRIMREIEKRYMVEREYSLRMEKITSDFKSAIEKMKTTQATKESGESSLEEFLNASSKIYELQKQIREMEEIHEEEKDKKTTDYLKFILDKLNMPYVETIDSFKEKFMNALLNNSLPEISESLRQIETHVYQIRNDGLNQQITIQNLNLPEVKDVQTFQSGMMNISNFIKTAKERTY